MKHKEESNISNIEVLYNVLDPLCEVMEGYSTVLQ